MKTLTEKIRKGNGFVQLLAEIRKNKAGQEPVDYADFESAVRELEDSERLYAKAVEWLYAKTPMVQEFFGLVNREGYQLTESGFPGGIVFEGPTGERAKLDLGDWGVYAEPSNISVQIGRYTIEGDMLNGDDEEFARNPEEAKANLSEAKIATKFFERIYQM